MILSQTIKCASDFGETKAIEMIAKAGFDAVDYSFSLTKNANHPLNTDAYKEHIALLCETAKKNGVYFNQGHALTYIPATTREELYGLLLEANKKVIEIAGLMGAFGCALIAKERDNGEGLNLPTLEDLEKFDYENTTRRCNGCSNACRLTVTKFSDGTRYISGNRCEKGAGKNKNSKIRKKRKN